MLFSNFFSNYKHKYSSILSTKNHSNHKFHNIVKYVPKYKVMPSNPQVLLEGDYPAQINYWRVAIKDPNSRGHTNSRKEEVLWIIIFKIRWRIGLLTALNTEQEIFSYE